MSILVPRPSIGLTEPGIKPAGAHSDRLVKLEVMDALYERPLSARRPPCTLSMMTPPPAAVAGCGSVDDVDSDDGNGPFDEPHGVAR